MRLEPEPVYVLGIFNAQICPVEIGPEVARNLVCHPLVLKRFGKGGAAGILLAVLNVEIGARGIMQLAFARYPVETRRREGQSDDIVECVGGYAVVQKPVAIGRFVLLPLLKAGQQCPHNIIC